MTLFDKIAALYPELTPADFMPGGTIRLVDNSDGLGPFIAEWNHPSLALPTQVQLDAIISPSPARVQAEVTAATQARLDAFAQTRGYDGILSACTYATSTVPKFQAEGQYCVNARDATWAKLYEILAEVQAGTRPMPTGYADLEAELPALEWPA